MGREIRQRYLGWVTAATAAVSSAAFAVFAIVAFRHWPIGASLLVVGIAPLLIGSLYVGRIEKRYRAELGETREKQARLKAIESLCDVVHRFLKLNDVYDLRVTLLEVDSSGGIPILRQVARCQTGGPCQRSESSMTIHQGVAGRCFRNTKTALVNVAPGTFIRTMIDFGFFEDEAKSFVERGAYLCCPVLNDRREVMGVLSLDAAKPGVFDADKSTIAQQVTPLFAQWLTDPDREEEDV